MSGSAVLLQEWPDPNVIWMYGVVKSVPANFDGQLRVSRLADAWQDDTFRTILVSAGAANEPMDDPTIIKVPSSQTWTVAGFFDAEIGLTDRLKALARLPPGPGVDPFVVKLSVKQAFAGTTDPVRAAALIGEASELVITALARPPNNRYTHVIAPADLPNPQHSGLLNYWSVVFDQACMLGPRMVGALLLVAPAAVLNGARSDIIELFTKLEAVR
jgi:hypothetical protein